MDGPRRYRTVAIRDDGLRVVLVEGIDYEQAAYLAERMRKPGWSYVVEPENPADPPIIES